MGKLAISNLERILQDKMMSSQDKMTQYTNFSPHQSFELQDQQPRPSNKQHFETQQLQ